MSKNAWINVSLRFSEAEMARIKAVAKSESMYAFCRKAAIEKAAWLEEEAKENKVENKE